jgi:hypothetical protein
MSITDKARKSELLLLFNSGKSESEAHEEINKIFTLRKVS